jgi:muramoyltetrapeptide carboxypeptidase
LKRKGTTFLYFKEKFLLLHHTYLCAVKPLSSIHLKQGDKVAVIAPAGRVSEGSLDALTACMERWGLQMLLGEHVYACYYQFAGTDVQRAADLQEAINNPEIKAVICARGGYGCSRVVDAVDFSPLLRHPKWLVGYSDITALHARWNRMGVAGIHGVMSGKFPAGGGDNESTESLRRALFGESLHYTVPAHPLNKTGNAEGQLIGGNLALMAHLMGSADEPDTAGKILFLEDVGEYLYAIDRMLLQLQRGGKLQKIKGLIVGYFTNTKDHETPFGASACEIISAYMLWLNITVCFGFPAGLEDPNLSLVFG